MFRLAHLERSIMEYSTVIFDLDGTLLYTLEDLKNAVNYAFQQKGYGEHTVPEMRRFFGNGVRVAMQKAEPGATAEDLDEMVKLFRGYYNEHCLDNTRPYDGVLPLIRELKDKGIKMGIVSNKVDSAVKELAARFFPEISVAIGESEGVRRKPAPDTVYQAMRELQADPKKTVYIGDSEVDLATARAAGLPCISVLWGFREKELLVSEGADCFVDSPEEIPALL